MVQLLQMYMSIGKTIALTIQNFVSRVMSLLYNILNTQVLRVPLNRRAAAKSLQSCPTLCDPIDGSPPGSTIPGILQARTLEWVAISFCNAWKWKNKVKSLSRIRLLATPWTAAYHAPPSMGFSRQEYWNGVPLPSPPDFLLTSYSMLQSFLSVLHCTSHLVHELQQGIESQWMLMTKEWP